MSRKTLTAALALVTVLAGGMAYLVLGNGTVVEDAAELLGEGGEKQLRDPMRPAAGGPRVLLIALDGVGDSILRQTIAAQAMPNLSALLGDEAGDGVFRYGYAAPDAISILPSTTMAAWSSTYSGEPPARTGVPGNEWFVREEMRFYAPAPVSVTDHAHTLKMFTEGLLGDATRVPTLFERADVRAYVSLAPVYRGADLFTIPDAGALAELFGEFAAGLTEDEPVNREVYGAIDTESVEVALRAIRRHGLADLQVVYFPGVDLFTHGAEDPLRQQQGYLRDLVDPALGQLLAAYDSAGVLDSTYVVIVSDHGHTPVLNDDRHALETDGEDEPTAVIQRAGFRLRPLELDAGDEDGQDYQAAVAYQGAMAYLYLADRSGCLSPGERCDWARPPRLEEDVLPVVRALDAASRTGAGLPALHGTLDLIFARRRTGDMEEVTVFDGRRLLPIGEYLQANPRPDLLDLERRMAELMLGPYGNRSGDVVLLARSGAERPIDERFYFSGRYHSWHGSPHASDSRIPLIVARRGTPGAAVAERLGGVLPEQPSQMDVVPLVLHLLGRDSR